MLEFIEYLALVIIIIWFVDHVICKGKNSTRVWVTIDITLIFIYFLRWLFK